MRILEKITLQEADIEIGSAKAKKFTGREKVATLVLQKAQANIPLVNELRVAAGYGFAARTLATAHQATVKYYMFAKARAKQRQSKLRKSSKKRETEIGRTSST